MDRQVVEGNAYVKSGNYERRSPRMSGSMRGLGTRYYTDPSYCIDPGLYTTSDHAGERNYTKYVLMRRHITHKVSKPIWKGDKFTCVHTWGIKDVTSSSKGEKIPWQVKAPVVAVFLRITGSPSSRSTKRTQGGSRSRQLAGAWAALGQKGEGLTSEIEPNL